MLKECGQSRIKLPVKKYWNNKSVDNLTVKYRTENKEEH
jgi:hypothetical protein